jgi:hypothetical protein
MSQAPDNMKKRHLIIHHAKQAHGMATIALVLFVIAWMSWTMMAL